MRVLVVGAGGVGSAFISIASRREAYTVTFERAGGGPFDCPFPEARWASIEVGSAWSGTASVISGGASCSALQPK